MTDLAILGALLRNDFQSFAAKVVQELKPGKKIQWNWHLDAIEWQLEQVARGTSSRAIVTIPPRHLKSIAINIAWVAWQLGRDPTLRFVSISYNSELSGKFARDCRQVMQSDWYCRAFPETRLSRLAEMDLVTTKGGGRFSTSIGGTMTGRGGDIIIIDDPLKVDEAMSETARRAVNDWFSGTLTTRLDDKLTGRIILVMQRLHENDLAGVLLEAGGWDHLNLPAIAEEDQQIPVGEGRYHDRRIGDVLHPEREPLDLLLREKAIMGSAAFSAQYQQAPVPASGNLLLREWFRRYDEAPVRRSRDRVVQSWDTASKDGVLNDYSVCITALIRGSDVFILDVYRAKLKFPDLVRQVCLQAEKHGADTLLIEDAASGQALIQELQQPIYKRVPRPIACKADGDKVTRMSAVSSIIEAGSVLLPHEAPGLAEFEREILGFPMVRHDDQADALSQLLNWVKRRPKVPLISPFVGVPPGGRAWHQM